MAKRQRNQQVVASFHYLVKALPGDNGDDESDEEGFSDAEFARVVRRLKDIVPLDVANADVVSSIKAGHDLPFNHYEEIETGLHFGDFDGAYYGQRYRNNRLGVVEATDLNLRGFHYLIAQLQDGKILVGTSYHGAFGDYEGLRGCLSFLLRGNYRVASKTLKSTSAEIGAGQAVSLKLIYRKPAARAEHRALFGSSGVIAINSTDFGDDFGARIAETAQRVRGDPSQRKRALAQIVSQDELLSLDEEDIVGCSAVIRQDGRQRTVYLLGDNSFSTKFPLNVEVDEHGITDRDVVKVEMVRILRESIMPLMRDV